MFTGLVEGQGTVRRIASLPVGLRLTIDPDPACFSCESIALGDSIAISGCCLTVVEITDEGLDFEAGEETLSKTCLGQLKPGHRVNLERSLQANARLGGHFVQGHVDGTAVVTKVERSGEWVDMWFRPAPAQQRLLVPKGSIAIQGVSLTIVNVTSDEFSIALIPHTLEVTTLGRIQPGDVVNIENDILGKYVDHLLSARLGGLNAADLMSVLSHRNSTIKESPPPQ